MEMALIIVMPWLSAQDVGRLGRTCKAMADAARLVTGRRVQDVTQGWGNMAVPIENRVDDCLYPDFQYTPFSRLSATSESPFGGPWGSGEEVAKETRRKGVSESEFGGAMETGNVLLGPEIGCRCLSDCSTASHSLSDGSRPEHFTEEGGRSSGTLARRRAHADTLEPWDEGSKKKNKSKKGRFQERSTSFPHESPNGQIQEQGSGEEVFDSRKACPVQSSSCPCGRFWGGELAYDANSRLRGLDLQGRKISTAARLGQEEGGQECEILEETPKSEQDRHHLEDCREAGGGSDDPPLVMECGHMCPCNTRCKYRVSQNGLTVRAKVVRTEFKGWGLWAKQEIPRGTFVCEYAGELITTGEARRRQKLYDDSENPGEKHWQGSALLTVREHLPSGKASVRVNVDATRIGNVARFINHSCDGGNLMPCLIRTAGCVIPKLALFARRDVSNGEELSYSYGTADADAETWKPCFCGTSACLGRMPSECT